MRRSSLIAASLLFLGLFSALCAQAAEDALKTAFLDESFVDGKAAVARKLAALGSPASRRVLLELLDEESSWDRAGAFFGLLSLKDPLIDARLAEVYIEDSSMESFVAEAVEAAADRFLPRWRELYALEEWAFHREDILRALGMAHSDGARVFLEGIISGASPYRGEAFKAYASQRRKDDLAYTRGLVADAELKGAALARLVSIGGPEDLSLFEREFFREESVDARLPALQAFASWGKRELKERAFASALQDDEPALRESACSLFAEIRSPSLMALAAASASFVDEPFAALGAAEYLCGYGSKDAIALALPALRAEYRARPSTPGFGDWLAGVFTLGLSGILDRYNASSTESSFRRRKEELARVFSVLAGRKLGADYAAWEAWCLSEGLTVEGRNIVQELFSSKAAARQAAREDALLLLGLGGEAAYAKAHADYAALDGYGRSLRLAELLRASGWPKGFE